MPTLSIHAVDVYVARRGGAEWLVLRRAPGRRYAGDWRTVGGKLDGGETAWAAAQRELREETGFASGQGLVGLWALPSVNAFYEWQADRVVLAPAFVALVDGRVRLDPSAGAGQAAEHDAADWLPADAAAARLVWPEQARLLRLAADLLARGALPDDVTISF